MEKAPLTCPQCGRRLANILGAVGSPRRLKADPGVRVHIDRNALGEDLGWLHCPKCKTARRFDALLWLGP